MTITPYGSLLNKIQVVEETGLSYSTIYRLYRANKFPKPVRLSARRIAWKKEEVEQWRKDLGRV
ncbi:helix-turn-helix transcriptional regulator [Agarivorans sp. TSD2052]|uniref:helix-turn-helix transcriptional regulator n=1 Tax=Agarivorans sp. TSD2052 TaxID=2937286 RepID=UPI003531B637